MRFWVFGRDKLATLLQTARTHSIVRGHRIVFPFRASYPFLLLLARTGMRLSEGIGLQWGDINWRSGTIVVQRSFVRGELSVPKSGKIRSVDMSEHLQAALREHFEHRFPAVANLDPERQAEQDAEAADAVLDSWVFPGVDGKKPMDEHLFRRRVFKPLLVAAKLRHIRIHDLRHGYATLLLGAGVDLQYVSQQLGHHSAALYAVVLCAPAADGPARAGKRARQLGTHQHPIGTQCLTNWASARDSAGGRPRNRYGNSGGVKAGARSRTADLLITKKLQGPVIIETLAISGTGADSNGLEWTPNGTLPAPTSRRTGARHTGRVSAGTEPDAAGGRPAGCKAPRRPRVRRQWPEAAQ